MEFDKWEEKTAASVVTLLCKQLNAITNLLLITL